MSIASRAIEKEGRIKLIFFIGSLLLLFLTVTQIKNVLISSMLGFVTYYMLAPIVDFLERKGFSRLWATTIPFLISTLFFIGAIQVFYPALMDQVETLKENMPKYFEASTHFFSNLEIRASKFISDIYPYDFKGKVEPQMMSVAQGILKSLPEYVSQSLAIVLLTPFFAFFMLLDGRDFSRGILNLVPNNLFELALNLNWQISEQLGGFIRARFIQSILVGLIIWLGLVLLGFPYPLFLAIFAGILNVIPYLGPFIGALPALIINFSNSGETSVLGWLLLIYAVAQIVDTVVITPFIVAKIVDMHPVTVVLTIIAGAQFMGILGMIISIPIFCVLKVSARSIYLHLTDFRS